MPTQTYDKTEKNAPDDNGKPMSDEKAAQQKAFAGRSANHERPGADLSEGNQTTSQHAPSEDRSFLSKGGDADQEQAEQDRQDARGEPDPAIAAAQQGLANQKKQAENEPVNLRRDADGKDQFGDQGNIPGADPGKTLAQQQLETKPQRERKAEEELEADRRRDRERDALKDPR